MKKVKEKNINIEKKDELSIGFFTVLKDLIWSSEKIEGSQEEDILSSQDGISDSAKKELLKTLKAVDKDIMKLTIPEKVNHNEKINKRNNLKATAKELSKNSVQTKMDEEIAD